MSKIELTPEQRLAATRRSSLLVSAAAGSGKTRVLTQRLVGYVTDEAMPHGIDEFLIITYTRSAAAELRARIIDELSRRSGESPQNKRLRRQHSLCYNAHIGTIHSFCSAVLRENGHKLGLSPDFSVGDEDKCLELRERALEKTLEAAYEDIDKNRGFAELAGSVGQGLDDSRLMKAVLELHDKLRSKPNPEKWARECMEGGSYSDISETLWGSELMSGARRTAAFWLAKLRSMWLELCSNEDENAPLIAAYGESIEATMDSLSALTAALERGWDASRLALPIPFPRLKSLRKYEFPERKTRFEAIRDACKKACANLISVFDSPSEKLLRDHEKISPAMNALLNLTLEFDKAYALLKRRCGILDFSDLEHFALKLLCDSETMSPSALAKEISLRFREILVDEYQDVNAVQELILRSVSRDGANIFMVGDVKQSIYRFRLADPGIFLKKLEDLPRAGNASPEEGAVVLLKNNFRSDRAVLSACNGVFSAIMSKRLGDIDYDDDCALRPPDTAPEARGEARMILVPVPESEDVRPDKSVAEAAFVARRIKELVEGGELIRDGDKLRPARYGDIAILMRSPRSAGGIFKNTLAAAGIPVSARQGGSFFEAPEIVVMTSLLTVIDNPNRDVPLAAVLASPVFGFTPDELAAIRAADRDANIYTALTVFSESPESNEKCREFLSLLDDFRSLASVLSVHDLLGHICDRLELPALWTAAGGSGDASNRLMLFRELAGESADGPWRSLPHFLSRLRTMKERTQEPEQPEVGSHDAVAIMSVHKSKGLEFPVVFLSDTARKFNKTDLNAPVLIHSELGLGGKITDLERGIEYPGAAYRAVRARLEAELLSEEMRVLYVALTRAKEKLFVTCAVPDPEGYVQKLKGALSLPPDPELLRTAPCPAQWLATAALADSTGAFRLEIAPEQPEAELPEQLSGEAESAGLSMEELQKVSAALSYRYPFESAVALPSKLTATMLPEAEADSEAATLAAFPERVFDLPDLTGVERTLTAAERGVATHTVMQHIDFSRVSCLEAIEGETARLRGLQILSERQAYAVDSHCILRFFQSETGRRVLEADGVYREFRFSLLVPAETFYKGGGEERLLLQGVVDCCIEEGGELTIIDYKTDYVTKETLEARAKSYEPQLSAYALAMERITGKPVKSRLLAFLRAGLVTEL